MLNKILFAIALGVCAGLVPLEAQTTPPAHGRIRGRIIASRIEGHVEAISKVDGQRRVLHTGDKLTDQMQVVTSTDGDAVLVFSNGATVDVAADSVLDIQQFEQDPFSTAVKISDLKAEPGTSTTKLSLTKGELVGKVVHLNVEKGSEFTIQTPVGAAGIRGTTFRIVFRPGPNGTAFFTILKAEGRVVFEGQTSAPVDVPAGQKIVVTFNYTPPSGNGNGSGSGSGSTNGTVSDEKIVGQNLTPDDLASITDTANAIITSDQSTVFNPNSGDNSGGGGAGGGGAGGGSGGDGSSGTPSTSPSGPTQSSPSLTAGAGSG
jgi:hypothetical protein